MIPIWDLKVVKWRMSVYAYNYKVYINYKQKFVLFTR